MKAGLAARQHTSSVVGCILAVLLGASMIFLFTLCGRVTGFGPRVRARSYAAMGSVGTGERCRTWVYVYSMIAALRPHFRL